MQEAARAKGFDLSSLVARKITQNDFKRFSLIVAMDRENHSDILHMCPSDCRGKVLLRLHGRPSCCFKIVLPQLRYFSCLSRMLFVRVSALFGCDGFHYLSGVCFACSGTSHTVKQKSHTCHFVLHT
eukprot:Rmarinus@m.8773